MTKPNVAIQGIQGAADGEGRGKRTVRPAVCPAQAAGVESLLASACAGLGHRAGPRNPLGRLLMDKGARSRAQLQQFLEEVFGTAPESPVAKLQEHVSKHFRD